MNDRPHRFEAAEMEMLKGEKRRRNQPLSVLLPRIIVRGNVCADLGCGNGYVSIPLARGLGTMIGLDSQITMLEAYITSARNDGQDNMPAVLGELPRLPFRDKCLDHVLIINVFHEVEDKEMLVTEISRILRAGGGITLIDFPRRETAFGPPLHERVDADEVLSMFHDYIIEGRYDEDNYYHLELRRK